ncbi:MAG: O-antigen ligase family protein [Caulobacteraceae bacterium]
MLRPYVDLHSRWRLASHVLVPLTLALACFVYGFFFALTAPYLIVPFTAPVAIIGLLSIWAMPEARTAPVRVLELFFSAFLIGLILWPNYLALSLPGLPWITMVRLTIFPMAFLLLISLSISSDFRRKIMEAASGAPLMLSLLLLFSVNSFISLPFSRAIGDSLNKTVLQQLNWTGVFLVSLFFFRTPGRVERYVGLLLLLAVPMAVVSYLEFEEQHVLWANNVPSFLRIPDDSVRLALDSAVRSATGQYRAKATFSTPLGLAEYMGLMTPFAIYWAVGRKPLVQRLIGLAMLPVIYITVRMTDSRLGLLGYLVSVSTYVFLWSVVRFRRRVNDILAATIVYAYPTALAALFASSLVFHKVHVLLFGGGAQAASNDARQAQFRMAIPALLKNPIGHGSGESGRAMGYASGDFIAIDSYYINIGLDYGAIGLFLYVAMFAVVIAGIVRTLLQVRDTRDPELIMLIPLAAFLMAFLVVRGVFGQPDIHPLIFTVLGMAVCLLARAQNKISGALPAHDGSGNPSRGAVAGEARKKMSITTLLLITLAGGVATYLGCLAWSLTHN